MQFFSSDKRLQEIFFQNHPPTPPPPSRVKWSAPNVTYLVTGRFANVSVRQQPVRQRMKSIRQCSRSVHQRFYVSSPTSKLKLLVENNCQVDNLEFTYCYLFGNRSFRQRVSSPTTSSPTNEVDSPTFDVSSQMFMSQFTNAYMSARQRLNLSF